MMNEDVIRNLNFLVKSYDAYTDTVAGIKNRLQHLNPDSQPKFDDTIKKFDSQKGTLKTKIKHELDLFPIWNQWLVNVPGIGEALAGRLVMLYYYKFVPICADCGEDLEKQDIGDGKKGFVCTGCGKKAKGDGVLKSRIALKDFNEISSWWKYMGRHVVDGRMPKRKKGEVVDWSTTGRTTGYHIGVCFIKTKGEYKAFYDKAKAEYERIYPDLTKGHRHNMAKNKMIKLFLSHFWQVARTLEGKSVTGPYSQVHLGHTGILEPFYWEKPSIS